MTLQQAIPHNSVRYPDHALYWLDNAVPLADANLQLDGLTDGPSSRSNSGVANGHLKRHASHASIGSSPLAKAAKKRKNTGLKVKFSNPR